VTEVFIASACRTAIGRFQGTLSSMRATELGAKAVAEALARAKLPPDAVDEVIMGNVLSAGLGQNPARQAALGAGVPSSVGAFTVNKVCGSGLKAVMLAAQAVRAGDADVVVAGGLESMSGAPYLLPEARNGARLGHARLIDSMVHDGLWDVYNDFHMGNTAELVSQTYEVSREDQDRFAAQSHARAAAAAAAGRFEREIFPIELPGKKGQVNVFRADEGVRADSNFEALSRLKPAFKPDGTVTAGNASQISDGAAALVVMSSNALTRLSVTPLARILAYATGGCAPEWVMMAPERSITSCAKKLGRSPSDFDLHEINEAFAAAAVALVRALDLDPEKVNVNGGAIALGHPIGASGARVLTTLLHAMAQRRAKTGMASLCLGGGNAVSLAVEAL
jgi:acetyl-CoA C-acetyltransferase